MQVKNKLFLITSSHPVPLINFIPRRAILEVIEHRPSSDSFVPTSYQKSQRKEVILRD